MRKQKFYAAPEPFGIDENGFEILSYVVGDTYNYPLVGAIASTEALVSAAVLLRTYHEASIPFFQNKSNQKLTWLLPTREPAEIICHGDYAPYNVALNGNKVVGIFDFDTAHPAPIIWELAYAIYCWAPFKTNPYDCLGDLEDQCQRARLFCDSYGLSKKNRSHLVDTMIIRIQALLNFMHSQASQGNEAFIKNIKEGHDLSYKNDIEYIRYNGDYITNNLT